MSQQAALNPVPPEDLIRAVRFSSFDEVKKLLSQGADANGKDSLGSTALHYAARRRSYTSYAALLLDKGAGINEKGQNGNTPLYNAVDDNNIEMVRFLVERGALLDEQNNDGNTALIRAASLGNEAIVRYLLEKGAAHDIRNKLGNTARHVAENKIYPELGQIIRNVIAEREKIATEKDRLKARHDAAVEGRSRFPIRNWRPLSRKPKPGLGSGPGQ